jgi:cytochrome subunit of sulfide dehydrogenase
VRVRLASALALAMLASVAFAADAPPGALSCSGCHGPPASAGAAVPPISGRPAAETASLMREFRSGARPATVMGRIAKGFDDAEIDAIAQWLGVQGQQQGK